MSFNQNKRILRKPEDPFKVLYPANNNIGFLKEVRLIDQIGENKGIMSLNDAKARALSTDLDLVLFNSTVQPPIVKIVEYNRFIYEMKQNKKEAERKARQNSIIIKEIQLRPVIDNHDLSIKLNNAKKFIDDGDKLKIVMRFRGREMSLADRGIEIMKKFIADLGDVKLEKNPEFSGKAIIAMVYKKKEVTN